MAGQEGGSQDQVSSGTEHDAVPALSGSLYRQKREKELRKRLNHFLSDLAILGSLQGFRYFQPWLRGREELLLTVVNEDQGWFSPGFPVSAASSLTSPSSDSSSSDAGTPPPGEPPPQAPHQQSSRNGEAHLLPASPSEREIAVPEMNCTLFLLAGYAKYGRPYAWIRSNHERLVNIGGTDSLVRDTPMKLKSITDWCSQGTRVWDIVSELVGLCTVPPPVNPFSLDMCYLQTLSLQERFLVSGAIINFLEMLLVYTSRDQPFYDKVMEEVDILRRLHIRSLWEVQKHRGTTSPSNQ
uniref:Si:dkey-19b23.7 n=1 Tax=Paramormyrops kingsleyae TaxID=1676925 RepID=A0A3B3RVV3_9TELE